MNNKPISCCPAGRGPTIFEAEFDGHRKIALGPYLPSESRTEPQLSIVLAESGVMPMRETTALPRLHIRHGEPAARALLPSRRAEACH